MKTYNSGGTKSKGLSTPDWSGRSDGMCGPVSMVKKPGMLPKSSTQTKGQTTGTGRKSGHY